MITIIMIGTYLLDYIISTCYFYSEDGSVGFCKTLLPISKTSLTM